MTYDIQEAATLIHHSKYLIAFTGAGISVESGIPPFRGENGIWSKYDPKTLELGFFHAHPEESWEVIKELFYDFFGEAKANKAHEVLAELEEIGKLKGIVTQNIDNLHQQAGNKMVHEFHGNSHQLVCTACYKYYPAEEKLLGKLPPYCQSCEGLLKPDFIFFGEGIPPMAYENSVNAANKADVVIVIGSTGEVMPAAQIPYLAKENGAKIIEINTEPTKFTNIITDVFLQGKATEMMDRLSKSLKEL
jgi:NAD-dependent deacetylase